MIHFIHHHSTHETWNGLIENMIVMRTDWNLGFGNQYMRCPGVFYTSLKPSLDVRKNVLAQIGHHQDYDKGGRSFEFCGHGAFLWWQTFTQFSGVWHGDSGWAKIAGGSAMSLLRAVYWPLCQPCTALVRMKARVTLVTGGEHRCLEAATMFRTTEQRLPVDMMVSASGQCCLLVWPVRPTMPDNVPWGVCCQTTMTKDDTNQRPEGCWEQPTVTIGPQALQRKPCMAMVLGQESFRP